MGSWEGKVVLVTGAGSGIGRMTALLAARKGASIVAIDTDGAAVKHTAQLAGDDRALGINADVTSEDQIGAAVDQALARFGRIDMLHNNASILRRHEWIEDITLPDFRQVLEVNAIGMFLAARAVIPAMKQAGGGAIVNMSSRGGSRGQAHILAYSFTKAGVLAFSRGLAEQVRPFGIRVNALIPGLVETAMTREGPNLANAKRDGLYVFRPEEMAAAVVFIAGSEEMTGAVLEYVGTRNGPELRMLGDFETRVVDVDLRGEVA